MPKNISIITFGRVGLGESKNLVWKAVLYLDKHDGVSCGEKKDNSFLKDSR